MTDDKMLGKIRALLNKAEAAGVTPHEAEALSAKAAALMAKYSIDMAMVDSTRTKAEREKPGQQSLSFADEQYASRKLLLLYVIAKAHNCQAIQLGSSRNGDLRLRIFGFQADIDMVVMLHMSLMVQAQRALAQARIPAGVNARSFRTSWWAAYTNRLSIRLEATMKRARAEASVTPGTDLVLADRSLEVNAAFRAEHPRIRHTRVANGSSGSGWSAGDAAGRRADLGGARIGSRTAGAIR